MSRVYILLFLFCFALQAVSQQEQHFTQYMFNKLVINPAYSGSVNSLSTVLSVRDQWTGVPGFPQTQVLSVHGPFYKQTMGAGIMFKNDRVGPINNFSTGLTYAYHLGIMGGKLAMGFRYNLLQTSIDASYITYRDAVDNSAQLTSATNSAGTIDVGVYYYNSTMYAGMSLLSIPAAGAEASPYSIAPALCLLLGKGFVVNDEFVLNPSLVFTAVQGLNVISDINVNVLLKDKLWLGLTMRSGYGFAFLTRYDINSRIHVGYSFDSGVNNFARSLKYPTHEMMIGYDFELMRAKSISPRYL